MSKDTMSEDDIEDIERSYYSVEDLNGEIIMSIRTTDGERAKELVAEQTGYEYDDLQLPTEKGSDTPFVDGFGKQSHSGNDSVKRSRNVGDVGKQDTDETEETDSEQDEGDEVNSNYGSYRVTD